MVLDPSGNPSVLGRAFVFVPVEGDNMKRPLPSPKMYFRPPFPLLHTPHVCCGRLFFVFVCAAGVGDVWQNKIVYIALALYLCSYKLEKIGVSAFALLSFRPSVRLEFCDVFWQ